MALFSENIYSKLYDKYYTMNNYKNNVSNGQGGQRLRNTDNFYLSKFFTISIYFTESTIVVQSVPKKHLCTSI